MALYTREGDAIIWQHFLTGSRDAFGELYARFAPLLYNYGCKQYTDPRLAEDCIQDVFEYLLTHHGQLSPVTNVKAYLLKAYRRALLHKITQARKSNPAALTNAEHCFEIIISPESQLIEQQSVLQRREKVKGALNTLPPRMKEALFLRFYENLPFEDIAAIMDIDLKSVYKMIYKAFDKLRRKLANFPLWLLVLAFIFHA